MNSITPYYDQNDITIYCGECSGVMEKVIEDKAIKLTVTSPPYDNLRKYLGYTFDFDTISKQLYRVTSIGGVVVWVVADATINGGETLTSFEQAIGFRDLGFNLDTMIYKSDKIPLNDRRYQNCFEFMFVCSRGRIETFNPIMVDTKTNDSRKRRIKTQRNKDGTMTKFTTQSGVKPKKIKDNIWHYLTGYCKSTLDRIAYGHPAIFPDKLARDHIVSWSNERDLVLDPMMGSGTTLVKAQELNRRAIGIEISEEYCKIAVERLRPVTSYHLVF